MARNGTYSKASRELRVAGNKYETNKIDISKINTFIWTITKDEWEHEGDAQLSILFQIRKDLPREKYQRENVSLRVKVRAYATPSNADPRDWPAGAEYDRVIRDWYYNTDDPLSKNSSIWRRSGGDRSEFGLAGISCRPYETLTIEVAVTSPDPILADSNPKLKIVGSHPSSMIPQILIARFIDIVGLTISILLLLLMNLLYFLCIHK